MTVFVDEIRDYPEVKGPAKRWGTKWSHLSCGGDCEELHALAKRIGLKREYAQHMDREDHYWHHYDVTPPKRSKAMTLGAVFRPARMAAEIHLGIRSPCCEALIVTEGAVRFCYDCLKDIPFNSGLVLIKENTHA